MDSIRAAVSAIVNAKAERQNVATVGQLRDALRGLDPTTPVVIDTGGAPAALASYRGYYERLAIGSGRHSGDYKTEVVRFTGHPNWDPYPSVARVTIAEPVTAGEVAKALDLADGEDFGGYKGGSYAMHGGTFLHVAEHGDCGRVVVGLRVDSGSAVIETSDEDYDDW